MTGLANQTLGDYQLTQPLGVGATGQVFRARNVRTGRDVAVKVLNRPTTTDATVVPQLLDALRAAARLRHPHLVDVLDVGEADGLPYVVMELAGDASLRALLQRAAGPLPLPLAVDLVRQAADGLAYAHSHGLLHTHLTPDDLLIRPVGNAGSTNGAPGDGTGGADVAYRRYTAKVSDVGMVRVSDRAVPVVSATGSTPVAALPYLSPEQTRGQSPDARSDVYALGVVLYEAITGYPPFQVRTPNEAAFKHGQQPPPSPRALRPEVSPELESVVLRCLAKPPAERYAAMAALRDALAPLWPMVEPVPPAPTPIREPVPVRPPDRPAVVPTPRFEISLNRPDLTLTPGQPETVRVTLRNIGRIVHHVHVEVADVPAEWVRIGAAGVQLNPRDEGVIVITVLVPRTSGSRAGDYRVTLRAVSRDDPSPPAITARWNVLPFTAAELALSPIRVHGWHRAAYTARLQNGGNAPAPYVLDVAAEERGFVFAVDPANVVLPNGAASDVRITLRTPLRWLGAGSETQTFTVRATPATATVTDAVAAPAAAGAVPHATVTGQFVRRALLPTWAVAPLIALSLALVWWVIHRPGPPPPDLPTVQPVAVVVRPGASLLLRGHALGDSGLALVNELPVAATWTPDSVRITALPRTLLEQTLLSLVLVPAGTQTRLPAGTVTITRPAADINTRKLEFEPARIRLVVDGTQPLRATARNDSGRVLTPGLQLVFASEDPEIATVAPTSNNRAIIRGHGAGSTHVVVSQPNVWSASVRVDVRARTTDSTRETADRGDVIARSSLVLPNDGVPNVGRPIGPFIGSQRTATVRLQDGTPVGYVNAFRWRGESVNLGRGRSAVANVEVQLSGVPRLTGPAAEPVIGSAFFEASAGTNVPPQVVQAGALEYHVRLHPGSRLTLVRGRQMFQLDSVWAYVDVHVRR